MNRELIVNAGPEGVDLALLENKELVELHREKGNKQFIVGDIILGRVTKLVAGLNAAFVDVGFEKDAFLHYTDLGPQLKTALKVSQKAIAGNMDDVLLNNLQYEPEIIKTGKVSEVLDKRQPILVQVLKEPISTKGPRLTSEITIPGRYIVLLPYSNSVGVSKRVASADERKRLQRLIESIKPKNFGVVVRTVAQGRSVAELHEDMTNLLEKWKLIIKNLKGANAPQKIFGEQKKANTLLRDLLNDTFNKIIVNDPGLFGEIEEYAKKFASDKKNLVSYYNSNIPIFDHFGVTRQIKSLFGKTVTMPGGSYLVIEHTEALHVIDVNSGHKVGAKSDQETTALRVNTEAAREVARQLRLRDIGGIIIIDFIDLKKIDNKKDLYTIMKEAMKNDRAKHSILPLSKFGLMQITRERTRPEVNIVTTEECPTCGGSGKIEASILITDQLELKMEALMKAHRKIKIVAHPFIEAFLKKGIPSQQMKWSWQLKTWVTIASNHNYHLNEYHFFDENDEELEVIVPEP
ncbi:MAG: Rne/Rng family ribonuclease [Chitinophagales bacterium]|nr:Rne/Rng family ribonuclease [Chitinophagales bacterium]